MGTRRYFRTLILASLCTIFLAGPDPALGRIIYVDDDAAGPQDGSSWAAAFRHLQDALAVATTGDEIRVAQGVYRAAYLAPGAQVTVSHIEATFRLVDGVALRGGFTGLGGTDPDLRDPARFATILDGDLGGNDADPNNERRWYDNSKHIVVARNVGSGTVLDGLTITHGYAYGDDGSAISHVGGNLLVRDCTFRNNGAGDGDAGVHNSKGNLRIEHCRFIHNWTGEHTGALRNYLGSVEVIASEFIENYSADGAPGVDNDQGRVVLFGCLFRANHGSDDGATIRNTGELRLLYCTFADNSATDGVGAVACISGHAVIANCLFYRNTGDGPGAISLRRARVSVDQCTFYANVTTGDRVGGILCPPAFPPTTTSSLPAGTLTVRGCILWANRALDDNGTDSVTGYAAQICSDPNAATVEYCCIEGWTPERGGTGNIAADPLFVAPDQNDFHLKSQAGHWDAPALAWLADDATSPCIDAGDPNSPVGQEPFPNGGVVNLGVYGGTCEASKSWFGAETGPGIAAADLNGDGRVDAEDLRLALLRQPQPATGE